MQKVFKKIVKAGAKKDNAPRLVGDILLEMFGSISVLSCAIHKHLAAMEDSMQKGGRV